MLTTGSSYARQTRQYLIKNEKNNPKENFSLVGANHVTFFCFQPTLFSASKLTLTVAPLFIFFSSTHHFPSPDPSGFPISPLSPIDSFDCGK